MTERQKWKFFWSYYHLILLARYEKRKVPSPPQIKLEEEIYLQCLKDFHKRLFKSKYTDIYSHEKRYFI